MSASGLQEQDELPEDDSKASGNVDEHDLGFEEQQRPNMDGFAARMD